MTKTLLLTGATAGIGRQTARALAAQGHHLLVHGRSEAKVAALTDELRELPGAGTVRGHVADLSRLDDVRSLADAVMGADVRLDVLINNAGVFKTSRPITAEGLDVRFVVNLLAPVVLTRALSPAFKPGARVVNLSSAAQKPVDLAALAGRKQLGDFDAYAQSKLGLTMWSGREGRRAEATGPLYVAVNPGSMLGTAMVRDGFGVAGKDVQIGVDILCRAALSPDFAGRSGAYFDNDAGAFAAPHPHALDDARCDALIAAVDALIEG